MSGKSKYQIVGIDTNIFIYYFQQHYQFGSIAKKILQTVTEEKSKTITSIISLMELLSFNVSRKVVKELQTEYLSFPNLQTFDVTQAIALEAARIRREYGYKAADTIQLATALHAKADVFITNDEGLQNFREIKIRILSN